MRKFKNSPRCLEILKMFSKFFVTGKKKLRRKYKMNISCLLELIEQEQMPGTTSRV